MSMLRRTWSLIDWPLTAVVLTLIGLGLLNLYSATRVAPKGCFRPSFCGLPSEP